MPPLFEKSRKIKLIEYGEHADDGFPFAQIKQFFLSFFKRA